MVVEPTQKLVVVRPARGRGVGGEVALSVSVSVVVVEVEELVA